jgi:hypothetical protein
MEGGTIRALADITDEGQFEKIATAILRLVPDYAALAHPGINADGKTRKSPVDGLCYTGGGSHLIIAQHTITAADGLQRKWLLDLATVKRRKGSKSPPPPAGDVMKALEIVREERKREPNLLATLILTTNQEADEELIRDAVAAGRDEQVAVDIWTRSRLAQVLDVDPSGQVIRRKLVGIEEELLSRELLGELSAASIAAFDACDEPDARVRRALDDHLDAVARPVTLLVAASGHGKTVACHKALERHVAAGGVGLVLPHAIVEQTLTLELAVSAALTQLKPSLALGQSPFALLSEAEPLLIVVEDVSRSSQPQRLIEKIVGWSPKSDAQSGRPPWRLICPVWPHLLGGVTSQSTERIAAMTLRPQPMSLSESSAAAKLHARRAGVHLDQHHAQSIASALGQDPLLIALNRDWSSPRPEIVIERFVDDALARAQTTGKFLAGELREAIVALGAQLLARQRLGPSWREILGWGLSSETIAALRAVSRHEEILRIDGPSSDMRLRFRHDRVRDWLLVEAAVVLGRGGRLSDHIVAEPLIAEVVAGLLVRGDAPPELVARVQEQNPLALFHALRLSRSNGPAIERLAKAAMSWLKRPENQGRSTIVLRWHSLAALEDVEAAFMRPLIELFPQDWATCMIARMRNGDLEGGIGLCGTFELPTAVTLLQRSIAAARANAEAALTAKLSDLIDHDENRIDGRRSALIWFVGIWGNPELAPALSRLWSRDEQRGDRLAAYLWAFGRCATDQTAAKLLAPVCAMWGALSEERVNNMPSPKNELAAHSVRRGFERAVPLGALGYLITRAAEPDLSWQIEYLLHGIDHPDAVLFEAHRMAAWRAKSLDHYTFNNPACKHWRRTLEGYGDVMSPASRTPLLVLWQDTGTEEHLRFATFDLWASGRQQGDIAILRAAARDPVLDNRILRQRLERGDHAAIPELVGKLDGENGMRWWDCVRHVWSAALYETLDRTLARQTEKPLLPENEQYDIGSTLTRVVLRLPILDAERLLLRYWSKFGPSMHFVQAALFVATPELREKADAVIRASQEPGKLFTHLSINCGICVSGEPGVTREVQILAFEPYLDIIEEFDLDRLADACNENKWFETRRRLLDPRRSGVTDDTPEHIWHALDGCGAARGHIGIVDHEIDRMLKAGASWPEIAPQLRDWLAQQSAPIALDVVARALHHVGRREDVAILDAWAGQDEDLRQAVIADTRFAMYRQRG